MNNFRTIDRQTGFLLPPSVDEWLPEKHLARFVVEVIDGMDLRAMSGSYRGSGSASYHPRMLLGILVYGYATGIFSSRKLERATYDSVAFRFIAANDHPDHDTIATFRRRFLKQIEGLFVQVLLLAREMGMLKLGTLGLGGTKMGMIFPQSAGSRPLGAALTFVAIDFETADHGPDSACASGLVRVSGAAIVKRKYHLIRPPRSSFFFTPVHGITWEHVQRKPTFEALWPRIRNFLIGADFIAFHSVSFDRRVLE